MKLQSVHLENRDNPSYNTVDFYFFENLLSLIIYSSLTLIAEIRFFLPACY